MDNLLDCSTASEVCDGPGGFLLSLEVSLDEDVNERKETPSVNDHLDLLVIASSNVGDCPGTFLQLQAGVNIMLNSSQSEQVSYCASRHKISFKARLLRSMAHIWLIFIMV